VVVRDETRAGFASASKPVGASPLRLPKHIWNYTFNVF
jgi:hypothetical protein